ncbi:MAG TPA: hypothetical protein VGM76_17175 [Lacipirellulaceae bacterium]|jgi:hypothetical protein
MACFTQEQLATLALGLTDGLKQSAHIAQCDACRATLADMLGLADQLSTAHMVLSDNHAASRAQLMASLSNFKVPVHSTSIWNQLASTLTAMLTRHRFAAGGFGLSTVAGALLLLAIFSNSATRLAAMDRMLTAVRKVTSYSFNEVDHMVFLASNGKPQTIRRETYSACWRAPDEANREWLGDLHAEVKSWHRPSAYGEASNSDVERLALHLAETYPTGKPSLIVVYTESYYFWTDPMPAGDLPVDNTIAKLRAVQQGQGKIVRELGTKHVDGREARGYILSFDEAVPFRGDGPVEVWVDPQTDLPMELSYNRTDEKQEGKYIDEHCLTDIRWNIDFPPDQFATIAPADLVNTTPPNDKKDIAQIIAALKLYADLSGGHYPPIRTLDPATKTDPTVEVDPHTRFDGKLILDEMRNLAGFSGPPNPTWSQDPKYQQIEAVIPGLDWLSRILLNRVRAGFFGTEVQSQDRDKVLFWCTAAERGHWRIFYGDLQTEVVPESKFKQLVPTAVFP